MQVFALAAIIDAEKTNFDVNINLNVNVDGRTSERTSGLL